MKIFSILQNSQSKKDGGDCINMKCAHDSVKLDFDGELFGLSDGKSDLFNQDAKFSNGRFYMDCSLGECGMEVSTNEDGSELNYDIQIDSRARKGFNMYI